MNNLLLFVDARKDGCVCVRDEFKLNTFLCVLCSVVQLEGGKRKMKAENVETTVRDDKEFKGMVINKKNVMADVW